VHGWQVLTAEWQHMAPHSTRDTAPDRSVTNELHVDLLALLLFVI